MKFLPEGSIKWSVPADKRTRCKKQEPEDTQSKINTSSSINIKPGQTSKDIKKQCHCMDCRSTNKKKALIKLWLYMKRLTVKVTHKKLNMLKIKHYPLCNNPTDFYIVL